MVLNKFSAIGIALASSVVLMSPSQATIVSQASGASNDSTNEENVRASELAELSIGLFTINLEAAQFPNQHVIQPLGGSRLSQGIVGGDTFLSLGAFQGKGFNDFGVLPSASLSKSPDDEHLFANRANTRSSKLDRRQYFLNRYKDVNLAESHYFWTVMTTLGDPNHRPNQRRPLAGKSPFLAVGQSSNQALQSSVLQLHSSGQDSLLAGQSGSQSFASVDSQTHMYGQGQSQMAVRSDQLLASNVDALDAATQVSFVDDSGFFSRFFDSSQGSSGQSDSFLDTLLHPLLFIYGGLTILVFWLLSKMLKA